MLSFWLMPKEGLGLSVLSGNSTQSDLRYTPMFPLSLQAPPAAPAAPPEVTQYHVRSHVLYRFATTHVLVTMVNRGAEDTDAVFRHRVPRDAFVSNFSM